jgi:sugar lactone lactonase YvrE
VRIDADGSFHVVADLSAFFRANPVAQPAAGDFEPDGTPYSLVARHGHLFVVEANQGQLLDVNPMTGSIRRIADISASQGHFVPTALLVGPHGRFYVGNLGTFPIVPGTQKVLRIGRHGRVEAFASGFTTILGLARGRHGSMYVLETSAAPGFPTPGAGRLVRVDGDQRTVVLDHLTNPSGLTSGPDGALYISNYGFGFPPGSGQILRVGPR